MTQLKEIRRKKKLTMEQVANALGVTKQTIYNYENGYRTPSVEHLSRIADVYGITIKQLIESLTNEQGTN